MQDWLVDCMIGWCCETCEACPVGDFVRPGAVTLPIGRSSASGGALPGYRREPGHVGRRDGPRLRGRRDSCASRRRPSSRSRGEWPSSPAPAEASAAGWQPVSAQPGRPSSSPTSIEQELRGRARDARRGGDRGRGGRRRPRRRRRAGPRRRCRARRVRAPRRAREQRRCQPADADPGDGSCDLGSDHAARPASPVLPVATGRTRDDRPGTAARSSTSARSTSRTRSSTSPSTARRRRASASSRA